jgi:hypothetical protein
MVTPEMLARIDKVMKEQESSGNFIDPDRLPNKKDKIIPENIKYYKFPKNWGRIKKHLDDKELNYLLVEEFNKFTVGSQATEFNHGEFPASHETCMWEIYHIRKQAEYWKYVKHAACHWLVNFTLRLANLTCPRKQWRIISSQKHSTVWDGDNTLFDINFQAMEIEPNKCFKSAYKKELPVGKYMLTFLSEDNRLKNK